MRCVVFAYHDIGYVCLEELLRAEADVAAVFTHDDDPNEVVWFRSVRQLAEQHRLPVFAPHDVNTGEWLDRIRSWQPDFIFSFYYRKLLSAALLRTAKLAALNLHGSLLPRYRGRCPVNWVLIHGEGETGVTLHHMEEKPDRGDIVSQRAVTIDDTDTALTLFRKLTEAAATLMHDVCPLLDDGKLPRVPQNQAAASYFGGRSAADGRIDWKGSARQVFNLVRAVTHPYPGAFTEWNDRKLYVWEARPTNVSESQTTEPGTVISTQPRLVVQTADAQVDLTRVQLDGENEQGGSEWATAFSVGKGARLK